MVTVVFRSIKVNYTVEEGKGCIYAIRTPDRTPLPRFSPTVKWTLQKVHNSSSRKDLQIYNKQQGIYIINTIHLVIIELLEGMSSAETAPGAQQQKARKQITKKLSTGQKISLSTQDERTLRNVYDYVAGFSTRRSIEAALEAKKAEVNQIHNALPPSARLHLQVQPRSLHNTGLISPKPEGESEDSNEKSETDVLLDQYYKAKDQMLKLEEKLKHHTAIDHRIGFKDLDTVLKTLGNPYTKKQIDVYNH